METRDENENWGLVHTPNGEWICDYNVVFVTAEYANVLQMLAKRQVRKLTIYRESEELFWCYKHEYKTIELSDSEESQSELKN